MSKCVNKSLLVLAVIESSANLLLKNYEYTTLKPLVVNIKETASIAYLEWTNEKVINLSRLELVLKYWDKYKCENKLFIVSPSQLAYITSLAIDNIIVEVNDIVTKNERAEILKYKRLRLLNDILDSANELIDTIDPQGLQFYNMDLAKNIINLLDEAFSKVWGK